MSMWLMYLVLKLDDVVKVSGGIAGILAFVTGIGTLIFIIVTIMCLTDTDYGADCDFLTKAAPKIKSILIKCWIVLVFFTLIHSILPTTKQAAAIYFVPKVIANKQVRKMPDKLVTLANSWMDEQIKSIKQENKDA